MAKYEEYLEFIQCMMVYGQFDPLAEAVNAVFKLIQIDLMPGLITNFSRITLIYIGIF